MILRNIQNLSLTKLGALNGLLFGLIVTAPFALYCLFDDCDSGKGCEQVGGGYLMFSCFCDQINWWLPLELCLQVAAASFFVKVAFAKHFKSTILLWQAIGFITAIENYFYLAIRFIFKNWHSCFLNWSSEGFCARDSLISEFIRLTQPDYENIFKFTITLLVLLIFNFLFSLIVRRRNSPLP